jgi:general secretion pathway protein F
MTWQLEQKATFYGGLSILLNGGVPLLTCLESLQGQFPTPQLSESVGRIADSLLAGHPLHLALQKEDGFSGLETSLVRVGEQSGSLHVVLDRLAKLTDERLKLRSKLWAALTYPAFVLVLCLILLIFAPVIVFADLLDLLRELKTDLPLPTALYLAFSSALYSPWTYLILAVFGGLLGSWLRVAWRSPPRRLQMEEFLFMLPGLGKTLRSGATIEVCGALTIAYESGIPILQSLELAKRATWSQLLSNRMTQSQEHLKSGEGIAEALESTTFFSALNVSILRSGEEVGMVGKALDSVFHQLTRQLEDSLDSMQKLLEPLLLLFVGSVVGFIAVALLAPTIAMVEGL